MDRPVYISGPMTGIPEFNFPAFNAADMELQVAGWRTVNPADHGVKTDWTWADIRLLSVCGGVATLPGWENSKGARLEVHIATELGMPVHPLEWWCGR